MKQLIPKRLLSSNLNPTRRERLKRWLLHITHLRKVPSEINVSSIGDHIIQPYKRKSEVDTAAKIVEFLEEREYRRAHISGCCVVCGKQTEDMVNHLKVEHDFEEAPCFASENQDGALRVKVDPKLLSHSDESYVRMIGPNIRLTYSRDNHLLVRVCDGDGVYEYCLIDEESITEDRLLSCNPPSGGWINLFEEDIQEFESFLAAIRRLRPGAEPEAQVQQIEKQTPFEKGPVGETS